MNYQKFVTRKFKQRLANNRKEFKYHTLKELDSYAGTEVEFLGFRSLPEKGLLKKEVTEKYGNKTVRFWLPFCGLVDATTVKTYLP